MQVDSNIYIFKEKVFCLPETTIPMRVNEDGNIICLVDGEWVKPDKVVEEDI